MKKCSKCKTPKTFDSFCKDSKSADGYQSWCKFCKSQNINEYYKNNPDKIKKRTKKQGRERYYRNKINFNFSRLIRRTLKKCSGKNGYGWEKLVGYTLSDLKTHLEIKFKNDMNWDNYGKWHIDHRKPISKFNITSIDCDDFKKCWSLSNLQPLWAKENQSKFN